jgi:hypothetical protein
MYPEVSCLSRLLYSIYTDRDAQYNTTNNHTQYIILTQSNNNIWRIINEDKAGSMLIITELIN